MIFDKNLLQQVYNSNEFKGWLLSRRWFGDKSKLSNLEFKVIVDYFHILSDIIFLTIIKIETQNYTKFYFLPVIFYDKIENILESSEKDKNNVVKLTDNTFSKKIVLTIETEQKIITLNLVEAEYCVFFWKNMLFDKELTETFPIFSLNLSLYEDQFRDEINLRKVQNLIEASLYSDRYELSLEQLGKGNTTNLVFQLNLINKRNSDKKPISYILKSYKEYVGSLEPSILFVLVKNNFPNAPKIYGTLKLREKEIIGISEHVSNIGNLGDIYWNELNHMINDTFINLNEDYSLFDDKSEIIKVVKKYCTETLKVSNTIGSYIKKLHESLMLPEEGDYTMEAVESEFYLRNYTQKLNLMISNLQTIMSDKPEESFFNLPKISSLLIDIQDIIDKFRNEFASKTIQIQPVHQNLHMGQILYDKINGDYHFNFIDFEGDPELTQQEKKNKFPIEKDLASFLRSLSYIKFNTLLNFIETKIIKKNSYEVPEEILYSVFFRKSTRIQRKIINNILNMLTQWEEKLISRIIKTLNPNITLINYYYIERALLELYYEILYRPHKIIVPILGLKEIIDRN